MQFVIFSLTVEVPSYRSIVKKKRVFLNEEYQEYLTAAPPEQVILIDSDTYNKKPSLIS